MVKDKYLTSKLGYIIANVKDRAFQLSLSKLNIVLNIHGFIKKRSYGRYLICTVIMEPTHYTFTALYNDQIAGIFTTKVD